MLDNSDNQTQITGLLHLQKLKEFIISNVLLAIQISGSTQCPPREMRDCPPSILWVCNTDIEYE